MEKHQTRSWIQGSLSHNETKRKNLGDFNPWVRAVATACRSCVHGFKLLGKEAAVLME